VTPLMIASERGYGGIVERLLALGASALVRNASGQRAEDMAARKGFAAVHSQLAARRVALQAEEAAAAAAAAAAAKPLALYMTLAPSCFDEV
jgi:ankyrin repeat protein